ncbi:hypothetical protein ACFLXI_01065, partial [Chloroflexota bacterium]
RFNHFFSRTDPEILAETRELPNWLQEKQEKEGYNHWQRSNLWRLHEALAKSQDNVTLVALWNGAKGDGPGGTEDMINRAEERKAMFVHLDARELLD